MEHRPVWSSFKLLCGSLPGCTPKVMGVTSSDTGRPVQDFPATKDLSSIGLWVLRGIEAKSFFFGGVKSHDPKRHHHVNSCHVSPKTFGQLRVVVWPQKRGAEHR